MVGYAQFVFYKDNQLLEMVIKFTMKIKRFIQQQILKLKNYFTKKQSINSFG